GWAEAEYDVEPGAWFFEADGQERAPFGVLQEVALQACGWMSAYMGSALNSDDDLKFRNLGGSGCQHQAVTRHSGTLTARVAIKRVSNAAGMILQHYEFAVDSRTGKVYDGFVDVGFFRPQTLLLQAGFPQASLYEITAAELARAESFDFPDGP